MKIFSVILIFVCFGIFSGCSSTNENKVPFGSSFNEETYIWESFYFPTNRVMDKK